MPSHGSWRRFSARQLLSVCAAWSSSKVFPQRADIPSSMWRELLEQTSREIAILVYAALFLPNSCPSPRWRPVGMKMELWRRRLGPWTSGCQVAVTPWCREPV
jgi:hypothetical protein